MNIGIPKETPWMKGAQERRVGLSPAGVQELVDRGGTVFVQRGAGLGAGFSDDAYEKAGAQLAASEEELCHRCDLICKVQRPGEHEWSRFHEGQVLLGYLHLPAAPTDLWAELVRTRVTAIGYEAIRHPSQPSPVLGLTSEIAGQLAPRIAGRLLEEGSGTLLGGIPGVPPADVVVLGGGTLGFHAARAFLGLGANVYVLEKGLSRAAELDQRLGGRAVIATSNRHNIEKYVQFADVLIGAVLEARRRTPLLLTREMMRSMKPGSVFLDFSIDQGGCAETSRPTMSECEVYVDEGVRHFCMPNVSSLVARTATHALTNTALPYIKTLMRESISNAVTQMPDLANGVYTHKGNVTDPDLAEHYQLPHRRVDVP